MRLKVFATNSLLVGYQNFDYFIHSHKHSPQLKVATEEFRGIKYVRISSLPDEQRKGIKLALNSGLIIKILREGIILNDCLQYAHYLEWYENIYRANKGAGKLAEMPGKLAVAS